MHLKSVNQQLWDFVKPTSSSNFSSLFYNINNKEFPSKLFSSDSKSNPLYKFLNSTLDDVRSKHAIDARKVILLLTDTDDLEFISKGVLKREISGNISYSKQRDHFSHTLYNYLLGCFIFEKSQKFKNQFYLYSKNIYSSFSINNIGSSSVFYSIWHYVSLLHDIGYILEGSILPTSIAVQQEHVKQGINVINDYFHHHFWKSSASTKIGSLHARNVLISKSQLSVPSFQLNSLLSIADSLRTIPLVDYDKLNVPSMPSSIESIDIFDHWKNFYLTIKKNKMRHYVDCVRDFFEDTAINGISSNGIRLLDHGVISGLILYQYLTFYYRLVYILQEAYKNKKLNLNEKKVVNNFIGTPESNDSFLIKPEYYSSFLTWATSACAFHNAMQSVELWDSLNSKQRLKLSDDPLLYLGIFVDILQEWDRYSVNHETIFQKKGLTENSQIDLGYDKLNDKIIIGCSDGETKERICDSLSKNLHGWRSLAKLL